MSQFRFYSVPHSLSKKEMGNLKKLVYLFIFYHGSGSGTDPGTASAAIHAEMQNIAARPF